MVIEKIPSSIIEVKVNNHNLEQVQNYMYLGASISSDGRCTTDVKKKNCNGEEFVYGT